MRRHVLFVVPILVGMTLAGCAGGKARIGGEPQVRRVTLSLFAGSCAS